MYNRLSTEEELERQYEDFGSDEAYLRQVVAPTPVAAPAPAPAPAPAVPFNPLTFDWASYVTDPANHMRGYKTVDGYTYTPYFYEQGSGDDRYIDYGQLLGIIKSPVDSKPGDILENIDPVTGKVNQFQSEQSRGVFGDLWRDLSSVAADVAPVVQAVPVVGQAVQAINAINAAREGNALPALGTLAGMGGYTEAAKGIQALSAIKNEDYLGAIVPALQAAGIENIGGYSQQDIGKALNLARAIEKESLPALFSAASSYLPSGIKAEGLDNTVDAYSAAMADVDEDVSLPPVFPEDFGYVEPTRNIRDAEYVTQIDPLQELKLQTGLTPDNEGFYLADLDAPLAPAPEPVPEPTPISAPERMAFLEANIPEPETVQQLMQQYFPELYVPADQRIEVTGTREVPIEQNAFEQYVQQYAQPIEPAGVLEGPSTIEVTGNRQPLPWEGPSIEEDVIIPDWDVMEVPDRTPGSPTDTTPQPPKPDDDRTVPPTPASGKAPAAAKPKDTGMDLGALFAMLAAMSAGQQQPKESYQLANVRPGLAMTPYGIYGA